MSTAPRSTMHSAKGTRLNKRGLETRDVVLRSAVRCLAEGGPESVSANRVAREAGVTWGTVQHQFGDVDGLWAALLTSVAERASSLILATAPEAEQPELGDRVDQVVRLIWDALEKPAVRAVHNLRRALPRERATLEADFPRTADALADWDIKWDRAVREAFSGFDVEATKLRRVRTLLPGAVRGLHDEQHLSSYADIMDARRGLTEAVTAYLS
jgi:AcrR family transcriptional regulator